MSWEEGIVATGVAPPVEAEPRKERSPPKAWRGILIGLVAALLVAGLVLLAMRFAPGIVRRVQDRMWEELKKSYWILLFASPVFYIACVVILLLERWFPADKEQPIFGASLAQDFVWIFVSAILNVLILVTFNSVLRAVIRKQMPWAIVTAWSDWPAWSRWLLAILAADFLGWFHHWVRHKVHFFWLFHTVHHSQKHLNMFTDFRYHVVEYLIGGFIRVSVMTLLNFRQAEIITWLLIHEWFARFYHANIRTNLGWLRYIFVTPQSHRVHHSPEPRHWDKNFGVMFSIWDRMFGTQYKGHDEYPKTGVPDQTFPHETSASIKSLLWTPVAQMIYPFRAMWGKKSSQKPVAGSQ
jgi:sterol desaturase/sphingolipid hydroxylase (fatty acid hydroxylase superfamily)